MSAPADTTSQGLAARRAALAALGSVLDKHAPLDDAMGPAFAALEGRDRAFARLLVATTLRRLAEIDRLINACLDKALPEKARAALDILRLGVTQIVFLDVPHHAALDTANRLASRHRNPAVRRLKPLINAVLRRLTRENPPPLPPLEAGELNTPDWLLSAWRQAYGEETARDIAAAHMAVPPVDITLMPGEDPTVWADRLGAEILPTGSLRRASDGALTDLAGFADGRWWVQDAAAALPARLLGDAAGKTAIDLCAAPGGKTAQLAAMGAKVTAVDRSPERLQRVRDNLQRLNLKAEIVAADATNWRPDAPADLVLLDAPCSATGTLRRHPDLPHIKSREAIADLLPLQAALLDNAAAMLAPGGTLIYCVCSLEPEEGEAQIADFLQRHTLVKRRPVTPDEVPGLELALSDKGDLRLLPGLWADKGGLDGFFIARFERPA